MTVEEQVEWLTRRADEMERLLGMPEFELVVPLDDEDGLRFNASEQIVVYRQIATQLEGYQRALVAHHSFLSELLQCSECGEALQLGHDCLAGENCDE